MKLIGVGVHRTGTSSVQMALGYLGFNAYHGRSLWWHLDHAKEWMKLLRTEPSARRLRFLHAFDAIAGDWPAFCFWEKLCAHWPDAKVLLTVRDPEVWATSFERTIAQSTDEARMSTADNTRLARAALWEPGAIWEHTDRASLIAAYNRHNQMVQETIAPERLLVMDVKDGWGRLAEHVGMETPDIPFPNLNPPERFLADGTYWQIWVKGDRVMTGIGWGKNLEEACLDHASRNPEWAKDFDRDRLLYGGRRIASERP